MASHRQNPFSSTASHVTTHTWRSTSSRGGAPGQLSRGVLLRFVFTREIHQSIGQVWCCADLVPPQKKEEEVEAVAVSFFLFCFSSSSCVNSIHHLTNKTEKKRAASSGCFFFFLVECVSCFSVVLLLIELLPHRDFTW